jgi:hypothetical protein
MVLLTTSLLNLAFLSLLLIPRSRAASGIGDYVAAGLSLASSATASNNDSPAPQSAVDAAAANRAHWLALWNNFDSILHSATSSATAEISTAVETLETARPWSDAPFNIAQASNSGLEIGFASQTITAVPQASSGYVVLDGTETVRLGADTVLGSETFRNIGSGLVAESHTMLFGGYGASATASASATPAAAAAASGAIFTLGSSIITAVVQESSRIVLNNEATMKPGQDSVIDGATIRNAATGVIYNSTILAFSALPASASSSPAPTTPAGSGSASGAIFTIGTHTITAIPDPSRNDVVLNGETTMHGGADNVLDVATLRNAVTGMIYSDTTIGFSQLQAEATSAASAASAAAASSGAVLTLGTNTITAVPEPSRSDIVLNGATTLHAGQDNVIDGATLRNAVTGVIYSGSTIAFSGLGGAQATAAASAASSAISAVVPTSGVVFNLGTETLTAGVQSSGIVLLNGTATLKPGADTIVGSQTIRNVATGVVIDGVTQAFSALATGTA